MPIRPEVFFRNGQLNRELAQAQAANMLNLGKGAVTAPFTLAPDMLGLMGALNPLYPDFADQHPVTGDPIRRMVGLDPGNKFGLLGEFFDPSSSVAKGAKAASGLLDAARQSPDLFNGGLLNMAQSLFHGTPHKFDKFKMDAIGTGEGAQAYGHGLYFAESPGVAKSYQMDMAPGRGLTSADMQKLEPGRGAGQPGWQLYDKETGYLDADFGPFKTEQEALDFIANPSVEGHLYEVDIPDETINKMLDWDAPLSEQPEILAKLPDGFLDDMQADFDVPIESMSGGHFYEEVARTADISTVEGASDLLNEAGIPGIRYFDGSSRAAGEGTRNIVLFDEGQINRVQRDGSTVFEK